MKLRATLAFLMLFTLAAMLSLTACQQPSAQDSSQVVGDPATTEPSPITSPSIADGASPSAAGSATASTPAAGQMILTDRPDRRILQLPNGLIVVAQQVTTSPVVSVQCWVKTGSIYEQEFVGAGLSHFLEHLLAGGTTSTRSEEESNRILGQIGANTNAATSLDTAHYYIETTSTHTVAAIDLLSDWMQNTLITDEEFNREREVIQNEFSMGDGEPGRIFWKLTQQARYQAHPARHPTIGYLDEFLSITPQQIRDFYHRMYVPNNIIFVVAGDIDPRKVTDQVARLWEHSKPSPLPQLSFPVEPALTQVRETSGVADVRKPRLRLAWPTTQLGTADDYALDLLAVVMGQGESSRLVQAIRNKRESVTTISAYHSSFHWGQGFFAIDAEVAIPELATQPGTAQPQPTPEFVSGLIRRTGLQILDQIKLIADKGITAEELARAQRQTQAAILASGQTAGGLAGRLAGDIIAMSDPDYLTRYLHAIQQITADDVQRVARAYLQQSQRIQVTLLPKKPGESMPKLTRPADDVALDSLPREPLNLDNSLLVQRVKANIATGTDDQTIAIVEPLQQYTLPNGLRVILGRNTRFPVVAMQFFHIGGLLADEPGREGVAFSSTQMLLKGTTTRTAEQLARELDNLGAQLSLAAGNNTWFARGQCLKEDWQKLLEIKADVILHPAFAEAEWKKLQPRLLAAIDRQNDSWAGELRLRFLETYYPQHPWAVTPSGRRDVVAQLTPDQLRSFHVDHLDASQAALAIIGDIDPAAVLTEVERLFAPLPHKAVKPIVIPEPATATPQVKQAATRKPVAAVLLGYGPGITRMDPDFAAMQVVARLLSSFPTGWLDQALRGDGPGLVYAVGAGQVTGLVPGYFSVLFNSSPAQVPQALQRVDEVVERLKTQPIPEDQLQRAKTALLTDEFIGKQSLDDLAGEAALNTVYGLPLDDSRFMLANVEKLTATDIQEIARKRLQSKVTVILSQQPIPLPEAAP